MPKIIFTHGERGGVGKSTAAKALMEARLESNIPFVGIDADFSNVDVHHYFSREKSYAERIVQLDLTDDDCWQDLYSLMYENKELDFIVSLPAQIEFRLNKNMEDFAGVLKELNYDLNVVFIISRELDCVAHINNMFDSYGNIINKLLIVKNGHSGDDHKFTHWNDSKLRIKLLTQDNIQDSFLHKLNDKTKDAVEQVKKPFSKALDSLSFGERYGLRKWMNRSKETFAFVEGG
jgi:MinD-like ATPase involved in chromosome partitioning or flagellar assembly